MRIAIGSNSSVQIEAAREAWKVFSNSILHDSNDPVEFIGYEVSSELSRLPLDVSELMHEAQNRVENLMLQLKREKAEADFYIGLMAGFNVVNSQGPRRKAFSESWAYVSDGHSGSFGHSGGIAVPNSIADPVIDRGIELSIVLDRFSGERQVNSNNTGVWEILTKDILSTKHSYVVALISAFAPFYNRDAFGLPSSK